MVKVVFSDMDGTLLNNAHKLSECTAKAVMEVRRKGVRFVLASGRPAVTMRPFHTQLGLSEPMICCNGAMVVEGDEVLDFFPLSTEIVKKLIALGLKMQVYGQFYNYSHLSTFEHHRGDTFLAMYQPNYEAVSGLKVQFYEAADAPLESVSKWMFLGEHERLCEVRQVIEAELGDEVDVAFSQRHFLEVMAKGVSKGRAALALLKKWGIDTVDAVAFGDEANDKELLSVVGCGYVMKNGIEALKQSGKAVTPFGNDEDGVAKVLEGLIL